MKDVALCVIGISNFKFANTNVYTARASIPKTWYREYLTSIRQVVRAFDMNPKVAGLSATRVETFSVSKTSTLSKEHSFALHWRHNDHGGVLNHQPHGCLLNRLFRRRSKKSSKLRVTGHCAGNSFDDVIMVSRKSMMLPVPVHSRHFKC